MNLLNLLPLYTPPRQWKRHCTFPTIINVFPWFPIPPKKALLRTEQGQSRNTCAIHHMVRTIAHKTTAFVGSPKVSYGKTNLERLKSFSEISKDHSISQNHHQLNHIPIHLTPHRFKSNWQNHAVLRHTKVMHKNYSLWRPSIDKNDSPMYGP